MESLKELRAKVKELRASQKPLSKATADDLKAEIDKHERAMKVAARIENLKKAREAKTSKKEDVVIPSSGTARSKTSDRLSRSESVIMPKKAFVKEHKELVKELKEAKPKTLKAEAKKQEKELATVMQSEKAASKKKVSRKVKEPQSESEDEPVLLAKHRR